MYQISQSVTMKKIVFFFAFLSLFACQEKAVLLPQIDQTIQATVVDHSPIYMFFNKEKSDTLVAVNRKNSISSTNWIFNIDKRLPLRLVVPELQKLLAKKVGSAHKSAASENYFSYSDSIHKQLAFLPITKMRFTLGKPKFGVRVYFDTNNQVFVNEVAVNNENFASYLAQFSNKPSLPLTFCFAKNSSYENFVKGLVLAQSQGLQVVQVFVY